MTAAVVDAPHLVRLLLRAGAKVNHQAKNGSTALDIAIYYNSTKAAQVLRAAGGRSVRPLK